MIYTAIDTFYLTDEELKNSPSRKDDIDEATETSLGIYGCHLIQEGGILLKLPQAVMATGQVLFHRFYCKVSFARFDVKRVAASCLWLASKLEECPRKARHILIVFHRMECRREKLPIEHLDTSSKKYSDLRSKLVTTERHLLKEMGFICHVEHPHKFICNYLSTLDILELTQEAWNLANDSLRTTLCVRFKSEVVACGVVYAAARRFQIPLPEDPPWSEVFDAEKSAVDEVCRVLAHLYSLPKPEYLPVYKGRDAIPPSPQDQPVPKDSSARATESEEIRDVKIKAALEKLKEWKKSDDESKSEHWEKARVTERGETERDRDKDREKSYRSKDKHTYHGVHTGKSRHRSSRDRDYYYSREKERRRHH